MYKALLLDGAWTSRPTAVWRGSFLFPYLGLAWAISEDAGDSDFNDAVVLFTYYSAAPPL